LKKIKEEYKKSKNMTFSISTFRKILKTHFKLNYKTIVGRHPYLKTKSFIEEKYIFLKLLLKMLAMKYTIVFIDESCFNFLYEKRKGWKNEKDFNHSANFFYGDGKQIRNNQLIIACTTEEFIYYENWPGTNTALTFIEYIKKLVEIMKIKKEGDLKTTYFFLDSSKTHEGTLVYNYFKENELKILYGVQYYSIYDLCEYVFCRIKTEHYKKIYIYQ